MAPVIAAEGTGDSPRAPLKMMKGISRPFGGIAICLL